MGSYVNMSKEGLLNRKKRLEEQLKDSKEKFWHPLNRKQLKSIERALKD